MSPAVRTGLEEASKNVDYVRSVRAHVLENWQLWHDSSETMEWLEKSFQELDEANDTFALTAAVFFVEAAITEGNTELVLRNERSLELLCRALDHPDKVRVRVSLADVRGNSDWLALFESASARDLELEACSFISKRAARWFAWTGDYARAERAYRRAIELAAEAGFSGDVKDSLLGLVAVYLKFDPANERLSITNSMARYLRSTRSYVLVHPETETYALGYLREPNQKSEAHMWLRHRLWESVASGCLLHELDTLKQLGGLYESIGMAREAVTAYVRAGEHKAAAEVCKQVADPIDLIPYVYLSNPWQKQAAFDAMAAEGDLIDDQQVRTLVPALLEALRAQDNSISPSAARVTASVAYQLDEESQLLLLEAMEELVLRPLGHHRFTDAGLLTFMARLYRMDEKYRTRISRSLGTIATASGLLPELISAVSNCREDPQPLIEAFTLGADAGDQSSVYLLEILESDHPAVLARDRDLINSILAIATNVPRSQWGIGRKLTVAKTSLEKFDRQVRLAYATKLVELGEDVSDLVPNRSNALRALAYVAEYSPDTFEDDLFARVMRLVGIAKLSELDMTALHTSHPLSRFRINFGGPDQVRGAALLAALALADSVEQRQLVAEAALELLPHAEIERLVTDVIVELDRRGLRFDPGLFASFPSPVVRSAAALIWAREPINVSLGRRLAADEAVEVRATVARHLKLIAAVDAELSQELRQLFLEDTSAGVRWWARKG